MVVGVAVAVATTAAASSQTTSSPTTAATPAALALPGPKSFVSGLDLECFDTPGPSLDLVVNLTHLNPVLVHLGLPAHNVIIRELQQTCVPVEKNGVAPPASAAPFIQNVDLACYRVDAAALTAPVSLALTHLNPVLSGLPVHKDALFQPAHLCLPVAKNNVLPPSEVLRLVQFLDLECYKVDPDPHPSFAVRLKQLNPQLGNIPLHTMSLVSAPRELCVPVQKNQQAIPSDILNIIQWVDLEKFFAQPLVNVAPVSVRLRQLNPLFTTLAQVAVTLQQASALMVPVAKNNVFPPAP